MDRHMTFTYKNHAGETAERHVVPHAGYFGSTPFHPEKQWMLRGFDLDRQAFRDFALSDFLGDVWNEPEVTNGDFKAAQDKEFAELSKRAAALGYQIVSNEEGNLLGSALTVGGGLSVYGSIEALGRVQNFILASSRHPIEERDTNRQLAKALVNAEALLDAANRKIEELTKLMMGKL